jgi:hypothetical protein
VIVGLLALWLGLFQAQAAGAVIEIGPGADWCGTINALDPGSEAVLLPGDYPGPCTLRRSGADGEPIAIRAKDPQARPHIVYLGHDDNVLNIRGDHVIVRGLGFGATRPGVDAIRIKEGNDITVEDCRFQGIGGIAIVANHTSGARITVRRNEITRSRSTAMYFGCHDGVHCILSGLLIERNYIRGVDAAENEIGYGIEVKLNSTAVIRDNIIVDTKGPGVMVYGAVDPARLNVVERNFVAGSRTSSAIVVGGGPAVIRNNVATTSVEAGIALEDYHRRGLLRGVVIAHNTIWGNAKGGIVVPTQGSIDAKLVNNAAQALAGMPPFPTVRAGILSVGNVDCSSLPCFRDPGGQNFSPLALPSGSLAGEPWVPVDDYFGRRRAVPPTAGAIEIGTQPISLGIKSLPAWP